MREPAQTINMSTNRFIRIVVINTLATLLGGCAQLFFYPDHDERKTPADFGFGYRDIAFQSADGTALHGWLIPATDQPEGTVVVLHGNAQNLTTHFMMVAWLAKQHFNVFIADYRGYGRSAGLPDITGVHADAEAMLATALALPETHGHGVALLGQSLGGSIAIYLAAHSPQRHRLSAVAAESAFCGYRTISRVKLSDFWLTWPFQWLPWLTLNDDYAACQAAPDLSPLPLLLLHGDNDGIIPLRQSLQIFKAAREPKELWVYPGGHTRAFADAALRERFVRYLHERLAAAPPLLPLRAPSSPALLP